MTEFLVETYAFRNAGVEVAAGATRARAAAAELTREGKPVRFLRSIFVPEDETCFYLFEAGSQDVVEEAARRAELRFDRIAAAVADTRGETR
jgi:Protein of unknown function (DUF4242)